MTVRQRFQFHRRLSLVGVALAHAQQGGGGIEQTAGATGFGGVDAPFQHLADNGRFCAKASGNFLVPSHEMQRRRRQPPGFAGGSVAAGQRKRSQMAETLEVRAVHSQQFAAPDAAVQAESDAIKSQTQHGFSQAVFRHDRRDMGVVVLHGDAG